MKSYNYLFILVLTGFLALSACDKDEETKAPGTIAVQFDHQVNNEDLSLRAVGDPTYNFTDSNGQQFNISKFGYYISEIAFFGPSAGFSDPQKITIDASKVRGFYQVLESDPASQTININEITPGTYDRMKFTIGIKEYSYIQGTPGGILDPANGAWFLNQSSGYVNLAIEGNAANSGQEYVDLGNGAETLEGTFAIQIGGWRDEAPSLVDNTRTIELDFDEPLMIEEGLSPEAHINVDIMKILEGIDFSKTYAVDRPDEGRPFANQLTGAFTLDRVDQ